MSKKTIYVIIAHLLCSLQLIAQQPQATNDSSADIIKADESASQNDSTKTRIIFKEAENFIRESKDDLDIQTAKGNVKIVHDSIYMYTNSAQIIGNNLLLAIGDVTIIQEDSINVFSDSLRYTGDEKLARLYNNVVLESGDKKLFTDILIYNLDAKKATFQDTAILTRQAMRLSSIRGTYDVNTKWATFYDQVTIIDEDFQLTCDSLHYDTDIDRAYFLSPTYISQGEKKIYCEDGYYDIESGRSYFSDKAIIREDNKTAKADNILVSEKDSTVTLTGNAFVQDSISKAKGETIIYNDKSGDITIMGDGSYVKEDTRIEGPHIFYNKKTEYYKAEGRNRIIDNQGVLEADTLEYIKETDWGLAVGNVIYSDTMENRTIYTERLYYRDSTEYVKAVVDSLKPLLLIEVDGDTLYVAGDTLIREAPSDSLSYLEAIDNVKVYKSDLQAVCDSLYYSDVDSIFRFMKNPVAWSDTTQFLGDTIHILLRNDKVEEIISEKNAFIISENLGTYYDQIKGKLIHSFLDSNELKRMEVQGNAESIYFLKDSEDAFIGPNLTLCSQMVFYFGNSELDSITYYTQPESTLTPMEQATQSDFKLAGFRWEAARRPSDISSLRLPSVKTLSRDIESNSNSESDEDAKDEFESKVEEVMENSEIKSNSDNTIPKKPPSGDPRRRSPIGSGQNR